MWGATFSWHVEDMDLYSINYLHFGAPKHWYSVSPLHRRHFEEVAKTHFHIAARQCPEFLRHKMSLISPSTLSQSRVVFHRVVQEPVRSHYMLCHKGRAWRSLRINAISSVAMGGAAAAHR